MNKRSPTQTPLSFTPISTALLQRQCNPCGQRQLGEAKCSECEGKSQILQRRSTAHTEALTAPPIVHQVLDTSGQTLEPGTRQFMESRFGQNFSDVRVHTDNQAATSAASVNAAAYTVGKNIVFGANQYAPRTTPGKRLIAHELTHVMQQSAGVASLHKKDIAISPSSTIAEQEADSIAHQVMSDSQGSQAIHPQPVAMQREEAQDEKDETISSSSGFKLNKDLLVRMLVMCNEEKLDPVKCVEMRKQLQPPPSKFGVGSTPPLTFGASGKTSTPSLSAIDPKQFKPAIPGFRQPILPPPGWQPPVPQASSQPASGSKSSGLPDISFIKKIMEPEFDLLIGKFKITIPKGAEMKFAPLPLKGATKLQISVKGEITDLKGLFDKDPAKPQSGTPVSFSLTVAINGIPNVKIDATSSVNLDKNNVKLGLGVTVFDGSCHFKVPYSAIDKINKVAQELNKYSASASADPANQKPQVANDSPDKPATNQPAQDPAASKEPLDVIVDVAPHIISLFEAIKEIEDAKKKCQEGPSIKIGPYLNLPFGSDQLGAKPDDSARKPFWGIGLEVRF